jgi:hypothetical protein
MLTILEIEMLHDEVPNLTKKVGHDLLGGEASR